MCVAAASVVSSRNLLFVLRVLSGLLLGLFSFVT